MTQDSGTGGRARPYSRPRSAQYRSLQNAVSVSSSLVVNDGRPEGTMIRVLVAEDMRILRDTLVSVLNLEDDIEVVAQVAVGEGIVPAAVAERPDVAVVDIDKPGIDGLTATAELHERLPACRVVILTVLGRPEFLPGRSMRTCRASWSRTPRRMSSSARSAGSLPGSA